MRRNFDSSLATLGMVLGYLLASAHVLPSLYFFPRGGTWGWHTMADEPSIRWYGALVFTLLGGVVGGAIGGWTGLRIPWRLAIAAPIVGLALLLWGEWHWF
jgi:hypothetical protein